MTNPTDEKEPNNLKYPYHFDSATELNHPCRNTCSGWKQGYEMGAKNCPRCSHLFYHPDTMIKDAKQWAAEWEEHAKGWESCAKLAQSKLAEAEAKVEKLRKALTKIRSVGTKQDEEHGQLINLQAVMAGEALDDAGEGN